MTRATARLLDHRLAYLGAAAAILATVVRSEAQDDSSFHEIETKYIFGFTIGSSVGLEGRAVQRSLLELLRIVSPKSHTAGYSTARPPISDSRLPECLTP